MMRKISLPVSRAVPRASPLVGRELSVGEGLLCTVALPRSQAAHGKVHRALFETKVVDGSLRCGPTLSSEARSRSESLQPQGRLLGGLQALCIDKSAAQIL